MSFKEFLNEAKYERAIFECYLSEGAAQTLVDDLIWDCVESQEHVTIEDVLVYEGSDNRSSMIHFIGHMAQPSNNWKRFSKEVQQEFKKLTLERYS